jgi:hypothetical protein
MARTPQRERPRTLPARRREALINSS